MPEFPRGIVTFLFTDIEGSTALWERDRMAMLGAVERHFAILNAVISEHGGVSFKQIGDGLQVAFPTMAAALAAAVEAQLSFAAESWLHTGPLRVRMALHTAPAAPDSSGNYAAPGMSTALERGLRWSDPPHGGGGGSGLGCAPTADEAPQSRPSLPARPDRAGAGISASPLRSSGQLPSS